MNNRKPLWLIILMVIFFPITIWFVIWKSKRLSTVLKTVITILIVMIFYAMGKTNPSQSTNDPKSLNSLSSNPSQTATPLPTLAPSHSPDNTLLQSTEKPVEIPSPQPTIQVFASPTSTPTATQTASPMSTPTATQTTAPTPRPTTTPTPRPTITASPEQDKSNIVLLSITSPIGRNETAKIEIKGIPNTDYDISVYYSTSESKASGLENKTSDKDGNVSWSWKIGGKTEEGNHYLLVKGAGETLKVIFMVK